MNIEIANRLVNLRKKNGLSQEQLAAKLGLSRQAVSKWERAEASPDTDNLICLAKLYGVSLDDLLNTDEPVEDIAREQEEKRAEEEKSETTAASFSPAKKTLQPGKPGWKETIAWLSDLRKDPATVKANYNITEENFEALCKAAGRAS